MLPVASVGWEVKPYSLTHSVFQIYNRNRAQVPPAFRHFPFPHSPRSGQSPATKRFVVHFELKQRFWWYRFCIHP